LENGVDDCAASAGFPNTFSVLDLFDHQLDRSNMEVSLLRTSASALIHYPCTIVPNPASPDAPLGPLMTLFVPRDISQPPIALRATVIDLEGRHSKSNIPRTSSTTHFAPIMDYARSAFYR
jgi:hypothetical protein